MEWLVGQFTATAALGSAAPGDYWPATKATASPVVRRIGLQDLREALRRGLHDFAAARTDVAFMCLIYPVVGLFIAVADARGQFLPLLFPTAAGFALVGPLFAIGLYEMSRNRELTGKISLLDVFKVIRSPQRGAIAGLGLLLIALFFIWLAVAQLIFAVTIGQLPSGGVSAFLAAVFTTPAGWAMILIGMAVGLIFAVAVLAISVVSFPLLLDRPVSLGTAIATSRTALRRNPFPLAVWGFIVALGLFLGSLPCFIGLAVVLPVLGHATWHLYRALVRS
jgi:uncharacterized membrane protein